jgi:hypothetical protein
MDKYHDSRKNKFHKNGVPKVIKDDLRKPEFPADFTTIEGLDPLAPRNIEFDWEILRRNLHEAREEMGGIDYELLATTIGEILNWVVKGNDLKIIGRRAAALAWVVNPQIFHGLSAGSVAKLIGCSVDGFHRATANARREFQVSNRSTAHGWNFKTNGGTSVNPPIPPLP